jgi:hypothetical protein
MTNRTIPCPDGFDAVEDSLTRSRMIIDALRAEVAALKAKLARYEADLTDEQAWRAFDLLTPAGILGTPVEMMRDSDAAIRKVRGKP